jgi:dolichyl-diphosphooligosaccharide---protein glycosyltransferase
LYVVEYGIDSWSSYKHLTFLSSLLSFLDGYQISAIANRTTLADGNTWNHEHIALLGKALTSDIEVGYEIARHLADYVLVWGGGGGDDLAKSPHLARIANSVYRDHCPNDPTCRAFGVIDRQGTPSPMMRRSLLFNLHSNLIRPDVTVSSDMFVEVFRSKYGKVRIYEIVGVSLESKNWVEENRVCDHPGSWFCPGQYPPALKPFIDAKKDFRQLEDFNRGEHDTEYQKRYFEDLQNPETARKRALEQQEKRDIKKESEMSESELAEQEALKQQLYHRWEDSDAA